MDDSFSEQKTRDLQGILLRMLQLIRPGLITELCDGGSTWGTSGQCKGDGALAMEALDDEESAREGGKPEPGHWLVTGP